ncbi:MAG: hypothetical protein SFY80_02270 [Verrucomicrobiota bacterium]|nr:hypothetical protein [Verrucomicrobiota bacterium]
MKQKLHCFLLLAVVLSGCASFTEVSYELAIADSAPSVPSAERRVWVQEASAALLKIGFERLPELSDERADYFHSGAFTKPYFTVQLSHEGGIYVRCTDSSSAGFARLEEIKRALDEVLTGSHKNMQHTWTFRREPARWKGLGA